MIIELLMTPIFALIGGLIDLLPVSMDIPNWLGSAISLVQKSLIIFPADVWFSVITNVLGWVVIHMIWAGIEWTYKKIPGVS